MSIQYQSEKLYVAVRLLGSLTLDTVARIEGAVHEFERAYERDPAPPGGEEYVGKIRSIMGSGNVRERAEKLNEREREELWRTFFDLYPLVARAYYEATRP